jgi:hypothetical protein
MAVDPAALGSTTRPTKFIPSRASMGMRALGAMVENLPSGYPSASQRSLRRMTSGVANCSN